MLKTDENLYLLLLFYSGLESWCILYLVNESKFLYMITSWKALTMPIFFSPASSLNGRVLLFLQLRPLPSHSCLANLILRSKSSLLHSSSLPDTQMYQLRYFFSLCKLNMEKTKIEELINRCKKNMSGWENEVML